MVKYRFSSVYEALAFFVYNNPARQRFTNLLEADSNTYIPAEEFSGDHPCDIWASIAHGIKATLGRDTYRRTIFKMYFLSDGYYSKELICMELGISLRKLNEILKSIGQALEQEFARRELLPSTDTDVH